MNENVFSDFAEFLSYARYFNSKQRRVILKSLPKIQREKLESECREGGWPDLFVRNKLDKILDEITSEFGVDLLRLRVLVLSGKTVFIRRSFWEHVLKMFELEGMNAAKPTTYIFGGYRAELSETDRDEFRLVKNGEA